MLSQSTTGQRDYRGLSHSKGAEHRRHVRLNTSVDGKIHFKNSVIQVHMQDLSKSGALFKLLDHPGNLPRIGDLVNITLTWPLATSKDLQVEASLVRIEGGTLAVEFSHLKYEHSVH